MADNLTHGLAGALLAQTGLQRFCRKFSFEVICSMISPHDQRRFMREGDDGDQF
jgi:hypothetical protein